MNALKESPYKSSVGGKHFFYLGRIRKLDMNINITSVQYFDIQGFILQIL